VVAGRYAIAAQTVAVRAYDAAEACVSAVGDAHRHAGVPPWRPAMRESLAHARVEEGSR
jgi:hypothetical protein